MFFKKKKEMKIVQYSTVHGLLLLVFAYAFIVCVAAPVRFGNDIPSMKLLDIIANRLFSQVSDKQNHNKERSTSTYMRNRKKQGEAI